MIGKSCAIRLLLAAAFAAIAPACKPPNGGMGGGTGANGGAASWPAGTSPICTAAGSQFLPMAVSDGSGGAIFVWMDNRIGTGRQLYVQRVNAAGAVQWTTNGVPLFSSVTDQVWPQLVSDGSGGAIIVWEDGASNLGIHAQRVDGSGALQWAPDGVALCSLGGTKQISQVVPDGAGGAIVAWLDGRGGSTYGIYAQRVSHAGAVQWTTDGVTICTPTDSQSYPQIASDGSGGAIIAWHDSRNSPNMDVFAQRVDAAGTVQWTANGVTVSPLPDREVQPLLASDGSGGAIIVWEDLRGTSYDIYAQRINGSGLKLWSSTAVAICTAPGGQYPSRIAPDGAGGAIIVWEDLRGADSDIYAQRVNSAGAIQWTVDGVPLCTAVGDQQFSDFTPDGSGGALVAWQDHRSGTQFDIYSQRINNAGVVQWTMNGVAVCTAANDQDHPSIVSTVTGGAIVVWDDLRDGINTHIYAQGLDASGNP